MSENTKRKISIILGILILVGAVKLIFFPSDKVQILNLIDEAFTLLESKKAPELPAILRQSHKLSDIVTDPVLVQFNVGKYPKALIQRKQDMLEKFIQIKSHIDTLATERVNLEVKINSPKAAAKLVVGYTFKLKNKFETFGDRSILTINFKKEKDGWKMTEIINTPFKEDTNLSE